MAMSVNWGANGGLGMKHGRGPRWLWGGAETPLGALLGIIRSVVLGSDSLAGPKCRADWFWGVLSQGR